MNKGFLITDPVGNVAYIPAGGEAAKIISAAMKAGRGEIVCFHYCEKDREEEENDSSR